MTTTMKRNLVLFGLDILTVCIGFVGFILMIGSAGSLEHFYITEGQYIVQSLIALGLIGLSFVVAQVRTFLLRYFRWLDRKNKK